MAETEQLRSGVLLTVAYSGSGFAGCVRQPGQRTVQGELEGAIRVIDPRATLTRATSRTDTGVHARGQIISFDTYRDLEPRGWALALAAELPDEIAVVRAALVPIGYDPRPHVRTKTYRYVLFQSPVRDPFLENRSWRICDRLNQQLMAAELEPLIGEHDFAAFRSSADQRADTVRTILRAELRQVTHDARLLELVVQGNRFMHRMIRIIAGTVVDVGRGRLPSGACARAIGSRLRTDLGMTAPADGLYLDSIELDDAGQDPWPALPSGVDGALPVA